MRFLCLHGQGTNGMVLESQLAAIRYELGDDHTYEYLDGAVESAIAPEIAAVYPHDGKYSQYFSADPSSRKKAVDNLWDFVDYEGPFDGVIGFSSGAALAVALLLQEAKLFPTKHLRDPIFKVAVLFACISPVDSVLLSGGFEKPIFLEEGPLIRIPTAHIWGMRDSREQISREVVELCTPEGRRVFTHKGDHEIPGSTDNVGTTAVVHAIQAVIDTAVTTWDNSKILEATYET